MLCQYFEELKICQENFLYEIGEDDTEGRKFLAREKNVMLGLHRNYSVCAERRDYTEEQK